MSAQNNFLGSRFFYKRVGSCEDEVKRKATIDKHYFDIEEQPQHHTGSSVHLKRCLFVLTVIILTCIVASFLTLLGRHSRSRRESQILSSWRLDTQKNYTIDSNIWRSQVAPQERHYFLNISKLVEVSPDGIKRNLTVINGKYPGPLLEANAGDTLNIHVTNLMQDEPTTIHCHGLLLNRNENFYDGASSINQCPIQPNKRYTYKIHLDEKQWGTYWYHSHFASQYADGVFGPLVIHSKEEDELLGQDSRYDMEMVVVVNDYYHDNANKYLESYLAPGNENVEPSPDNGLMQGSNIFVYNSANYVVPNNNLVSNSETYDPQNSSFPVLELDNSKRYRIRVVNAGFFVPFSYSIDEHDLSVIETDGSNVVPVKVESIDVSVGQRYSFILHRKCSDKQLYWTRAAFNQFCLAASNENFDQEVKGIVRYGGLSRGPLRQDYEVASTKWQYNGGDVRCRDMDQRLFHAANQRVPKVVNGTNFPDRVVKLDVSFLIKEMQLSRGYFNDMTWKPLPSNSNTLSKLAVEVNSDGLRNGHEFESKINNQYLLNFDTRDEIVDIIINNYDDGAHPFHLHGYKFWVVGASDKGYFRDSYYTNDEHHLMNFEDAVQRDTINVSGFGWAVIRIIIDNPGVWPFHCHIGWHMESGLLLQINALQKEYSAWESFPEDWSHMCNIS